MKKILAIVLAVLLCSSAYADVYVRGYYRNDGTYVAPHYRSNPNNTRSDNWSTYGNTNPHTGEMGTRRYDSYSNEPRSTYNNRQIDPYYNGSNNNRYEGFRY